MLELHCNNTKLLLPESSQVKIDLVPPVMADGIEDNYTIPFAVPARGNERALGHVQHLPQAERTLVLKDARLRYAGQHLGSGVLHVLGSSRSSVKVSFSAEGLASRLKGVSLRDALAGNLIDTVPDGGLTAHAKLVTMRDAPHESHCFPMHINPDLYGSENPAWQPDASGWDATKAYVINDRVTLEETDPVVRKWTWQCTGGNTNKPPNLYPAYWRRVVFGLVNSYDVALQQYDVNTADGNFFAMVPWFRYDWIVKKALQAIGITATGDWFAAPATPYMLLANSTPLDASEPVGRFGARQTNAVTYPVGSEDRYLPCDTEGAPPYDDPSGLWDSSSFILTPDAAGQWTLNIHAEAHFGIADRIIVRIVRASSGAVFNPATGYPYFLTDGPDALDAAITISATFEIAAADVGQPAYITVDGWGQGPFSAITLSGCTLQGYRDGGTALNMFREVIDPAQHVPDMELGRFLQDVADVFGLEVVPQMDRQVLEFNVKSAAIRSYTTAADQSARIAGEMELDHGRRVPGLRFAWPVDTIDTKALLGSTLATVVDQEDELSGVNIASRQHTIIRSTRKVYHSEPMRQDGLDVQVWKHIGYSIPPAIAGDADTATDMPVSIKPVMMDEQWVDGRKLLMPRMEQAGESAFYATGPRTSELYICVNGLKQAAREDGGLYPGAMAWGLDNAGNECESLLLQPQSEAPSMPDYWLRWHQAWADTLVRSEPVITDLLVDMPFLRGRDWHRILPMQGQIYLLERLPVTLGSGSGTDMLCKGAYLRRLRPVVQPWPTPFVCSGPNTANITVASGGTTKLYVATGTASHFTIRGPGQTITWPVTAEDGIEIGQGAWCIYASNANGIQDGEIYDLQMGMFGDNDILSVDLSRMNALTDVYVIETDRAVTFMPFNANLKTIQISGAPNVPALPSFAANDDLQSFQIQGMHALVALPDFSPTAHVSLYIYNCSLLASVGVLPAINSLIITSTGISSSAVVDALVNALRPASAGTANFYGLLSLRTAASNVNYNACISAGWTIT